MKNKISLKNFAKLPILLLAVALTAQACGFGGGNQPQPIELIWWKPFDGPAMIQPLVQEFQKSYPHIRITYVEKDVETYEDELIDALAAGKGPDIFTIHNDWLPKHRDKITPVSPTLLSLREFRENFVEVANADLVVDQQIYAIPLAMDVLALYYNKDLLTSAGIVTPPKTWEELVDATRRLTRQDNLGNFERSAVAMGTADNINRAVDVLALLMLQNGTVFYGPNQLQSTLDQNVQDSSGNFFSPGARALEFYTQFANPAKVTYTWNNRSNNSIEAFVSGQVAMIFSYAYLRDQLEERAPFLNYGIAPVPQISEQATKTNFANYWAEAVSKQSANPDAAWQFLKFISSPEVLPRYYEVQEQAAPRFDIIETQVIDPDIGVFAENALSARSFYKPDNQAVETIFVQMINDVILRNVTPIDAVRASSQKINLLLRNF